MFIKLTGVSVCIAVKVYGFLNSVCFFISLDFFLYLSIIFIFFIFLVSVCFHCDYGFVEWGRLRLSFLVEWIGAYFWRLGR